MKKSVIRRAGMATVATSVVLGTGLGVSGVASAANGFAFDRIAGADRYETSALTGAAFGKSDTVILASGESGHYADALTASYLAGRVHAPVLLVNQDSIPEKVMAQITASGATKVFIVGGTDVVSNSVRDALVHANMVVTRLAGATRYDTAAAVVDQGDKSPSDTALLATGENFPDALGGGALAYAKGMPLAITQPGSIPQAVVDSLTKAGVSKVIVLGGTDVVSDHVVSQLAAAGITLVKRIAGADRAETSALLAEQEVTSVADGGLGAGFSKTAVDVASGASAFDGVDALGAAALSGKGLTPLLITLTDNLPGAAVLKYLGDHAGTLADGTIFGGTTAVSSAAETQMVEATGSGQATNTRTGKVYSSVQAAIDEAAARDIINVTGTVPGFTVDKELAIIGVGNPRVTSAVKVIGADGVAVKGLTITPSDVAGEVAGVYVDDVVGVQITDNVIEGSGHTGTGLINATGGAGETVIVLRNTFRMLRRGVFANPSAEFDIEHNMFDDDVVGSANDAASYIADNTFRNNDLEGIGLGVPDMGVVDNEFINNPHHVSDYTAATYDLTTMSKHNSFDEPVQVVTNPVSPVPAGEASQWIADVS